MFYGADPTPQRPDDAAEDYGKQKPKEKKFKSIEALLNARASKSSSEAR